ncbi:MAG: hypothetical protein ABMB14_39030, partial [Myxococcota bacterium]
SATRAAFWSLLAPVVVLGSIYAGVATPTEAAGELCAGPDGTRLGWFKTRPRLLDRRPKPGGTWQLEFGRPVYREPGGAGMPVCALPANAEVDVIGAPIQSGRDWWVPVTAGAIRAGSPAPLGAGASPSED